MINIQQKKVSQTAVKNPIPIIILRIELQLLKKISGQILQVALVQTKWFGLFCLSKY